MERQPEPGGDPRGRVRQDGLDGDHGEVGGGEEEEMDAEDALPGGGEVADDGEDEHGVERGPHEEDAADVQHGLALAVLMGMFNFVLSSMYSYCYFSLNNH